MHTSEQLKADGPEGGTILKTLKMTTLAQLQLLTKNETPLYNCECPKHVK
jgi:hypothetical protein